MTRILLLIAVTLAVLASDGCSCQQSNYREASSPDHRYVAIERELNCSALDPYRVTVSIRSSAPRFGFAWLGSSSKEVFAADVSLRNTSVEWLDNGHLKIACTDCEKYGIAERVEAWRDVKISFDVGKAGKGVF